MEIGRYRLVNILNLGEYVLEYIENIRLTRLYFVLGDFVYLIVLVLGGLDLLAHRQKPFELLLFEMVYVYQTVLGASEFMLMAAVNTHKGFGLV